MTMRFLKLQKWEEREKQENEDQIRENLGKPTYFFYHTDAHHDQTINKKKRKRVRFVNKINLLFVSWIIVDVVFCTYFWEVWFVQIGVFNVQLGAMPITRFRIWLSNTYSGYFLVSSKKQSDINGYNLCVKKSKENELHFNSKNFMHSIIWKISSFKFMLHIIHELC